MHIAYTLYIILLCLLKNDIVRRSEQTFRSRDESQPLAVFSCSQEYSTPTHIESRLQTVWCTRTAWVVLTGEGDIERWRRRQPISPYSCTLACTCHGWITSACTQSIVIFNGLDAVLEAFRHNPSDGSITPLAARPSVTPNVRPYRSSRTEHDYHRHDPSSVG